MLHAVKNPFILVLHSFSKHPCPCWNEDPRLTDHSNGPCTYPFTFRYDLSQFPLVVIWENTEEKLMPISLLLLEKVF